MIISNLSGKNSSKYWKDGYHYGATMDLRSDPIQPLLSTKNKRMWWQGVNAAIINRHAEQKIGSDVLTSHRPCNMLIQQICAYPVKY